MAGGRAMSTLVPLSKMKSLDRKICEATLFQSPITVGDSTHTLSEIILITKHFARQTSLRQSAKHRASFYSNSFVVLF